jgi:cytoskeletal protein CcmA (bactofilin family)
MNPDDKEQEHDTPPSAGADSTAESSESGAANQAAPADALSRTPDELGESQPIETSTEPAKTPADAPKKKSALRRFLRRANLYFLLFLLVVSVGAAIAIVTYLNSQKDPVEPSIASQELTEEELQKLANTDASVGNSAQTLAIQGNAIIEGQTLMRGNLNVAGNFQTGGTIQGSGLTISGTSNLGETQINSLQVAQNTAIQGNTTLRDLNVAGSASFGGAVTASQITVSRLIMSGNASVEIPNHLSFTGPSPSRSINSGPLGSGGSASVNGSDASGTVNVSTGNNPSTGCFVRITFHQAFSRQPKVIVSPIGAGAGKSQHYIERDKAGFSICAATAPPANKAFGFDFFVAG